MASPLFLFLFLFLLLLLLSAPRPSAAQLPTSTRLHFFLHEIYAAGDPGATSVVVAGGDPSAFGYVGVFDDVLREGPEEGSTTIGRAQGFNAEASTLADHVTFLTIFSLVFIGGELNGTGPGSLAVAGRSVVEGAAITSERSIVRGTGIFQSATGYLVSRPLTAPAGRLLREFDAYILHH
ncbi:dirigent protein 1-like [Curcuma longa]|uniref:dirigent protein 1-like n=1 Tax=Curcuma longa TaxID=136217 RepID=UPI003D9F3810